MGKYNLAFLQGARVSYPIYIAFVLMFGSLAMLAHSAGVSLGETMLMTGLIFAVPLQALLIENPDFSLWAAGIAALVLNFKFMLMSAVVLPLWHKQHMLKIASLQFMTSSTYMFCMASKKVEDRWSFYLGVALPAYCIALLSTLAGYYLWQVGVQYRSFFNALAHIILPIYFLCLTLTRKEEQWVLFATLLGLFLTPIATPIIGKKALILLWLIIAVLLTTFNRFTIEPRCGK